MSRAESIAAFVTAHPRHGHARLGSTRPPVRCDRAATRCGLPARGSTIPSVEFAPSFVAPIGAAPSGSSLLAVLAGYVLPGSGGAPASTIILLIVLGTILGVTYGAFPQMTERLAAGRLLGASAGHALAVRRPG